MSRGFLLESTLVYNRARGQVGRLAVRRVSVRDRRARPAVECPHPERAAGWPAPLQRARRAHEGARRQSALRATQVPRGTRPPPAPGRRRTARARRLRADQEGPRVPAARGGDRALGPRAGRRRVAQPLSAAYQRLLVPYMKTPDVRAAIAAARTCSRTIPAL